MAIPYGPTASQFKDMLTACLSNLHDVTVTEVPTYAEGMHKFYVTSNPLEYIRYVYYDSADTQEAAEFNCRELTDCVLDAYEWARMVEW